MTLCLEYLEKVQLQGHGVYSHNSIWSKARETETVTFPCYLLAQSRPKGLMKGWWVLGGGCCCYSALDLSPLLCFSLLCIISGTCLTPPSSSSSNFIDRVASERCWLKGSAGDSRKGLQKSLTFCSSSHFPPSSCLECRGDGWSSSIPPKTIKTTWRKEASAKEGRAGRWINRLLIDPCPGQPASCLRTGRIREENSFSGWEKVSLLFLEPLLFPFIY